MIRPLPTLDCHAHVSASVTEAQIRSLGKTVVFAMTREPSETHDVAQCRDPNLVWSCGAHPANIAKRGDFDIDEFAQRSSKFAVAGEVGLDRRSGNLTHQVEVLDEIFYRLRGEPVLFSIHSSGCTNEMLEVLGKHRPKGAILHWFTGQPKDIHRFVTLGCYFSVNSLVHPGVLKAIPFDRVLPETDYPTVRNRAGKRPGDTLLIESMLAHIHGVELVKVRHQVYRNLRRVSLESGAIDRMPSYVADLLLAA